MTLLETTIAEAEKLFNAIKLLLAEGEKQTQFAAQTEQAGHILARKKQEFDIEKDTFRKEKEAFAREREFIAKERTQTKVQEGVNTRIKVELDKQEQELKTRKEAIQKQQSELDVKIKQFQALEEREKQIQFQLSMMEQEKAIDRQRKISLDAREKRLGEREDYVNKMAQV